MPRYYLHICNGVGFVEDTEGQELANVEAARESAIKGARDLIASEVRDGVMNLSSFIEVEDENRRHLFTLSFSEAVQVKGLSANDV